MYTEVSEDVASCSVYLQVTSDFSHWNPEGDGSLEPVKAQVLPLSCSRLIVQQRKAREAKVPAKLSEGRGGP